MIELAGESSTTELETEAATEATTRAAPSVNQANLFLPPVKTLWDSVVNPALNPDLFQV